MQTALALSVMAITLAVMIPMLNQLVDDARDARIKAVASGFRAAVFLAREKWYASGREDVMLAGYGRGDIVLSAHGWPIGAGKFDANAAKDAHSTADYLSAGRCVRLWSALLEEGSPTVSTGDDIHANNVDFVAKVKEGRCRFDSQNGQQSRAIEYDAENGRIMWIIR